MTTPTVLTTYEKMMCSDDEDDPATTTTTTGIGTQKRGSNGDTPISKRQTTSQPSSTYASITKPTQATQPQRQILPLHADRQRRTLILRRAPYNTTPHDIITALQQQFDLDRPNEQIDSILQDKDDRRRYYITFRTYDDKRRIASKGFRIGNITIPGQSGDVSAYIPKPPHYITEACIHNLLRPYGENIRGTFQQDTHGIRIGGTVSRWTSDRDRHYRRH